MAATVVVLIFSIASPSWCLKGCVVVVVVLIFSIAAPPWFLKGCVVVVVLLFCGVAYAPLLGPFLLLCWASSVVLIILCGGASSLW